MGSLLFLIVSHLQASFPEQFVGFVELKVPASGYFKQPL